MSTHPAPPPSPRVRVKRFHERGHYDRSVIQDILDAGFHCHVGFVHQGQPFVLPTLYWHDEESIYIHGSAASRMIEASADAPLCITVTHLDALVLTRSAFHHSANYRSVTILGQGRMITDAGECAAQLRLMMERLFPGRWDRLRPVTPQEIKATRVIALPLSEASAKIRTGPPDEDEEDLAWPVWGGVIPLRTTVEAPVPDVTSLLHGIDDAPHCAVDPGTRDA